MQISKIAPIRNYNYQIKNLASLKNQPSFTSFCSDANGKTEPYYRDYTIKHKDYAKMKESSTRIFRDLPSQLAIANMLNPNQKSQIKILGCADGSEVWGYAIAIKEAMGENAKNVSIQGVDKAPYMIETAKTGCLVLSDVEHEYAQGENKAYKEKSPIEDEGWDNYLIKTQRPQGFDKITKEYPFMKYYENDPVVKKSIGSGLEWYEINKEGLPEVSFEQGDMLDYLKSDDEAQNVVYVMANSSAYVFQNNPNDFIKLFQRIKENNKGKNVFVALGDIENMLLNSNRLGIPYRTRLALNGIIDALGFKHVSPYELRQLGILSDETTSNKLYKLNDFDI